MIDRIFMENESHHAKKSWNPLCLTWVHWYLDFCLHTPSSPPNNSMNNDLKIPLKSGQMLWSMSSEGTKRVRSFPGIVPMAYPSIASPHLYHLVPSFPHQRYLDFSVPITYFNGKTGKNILRWCPQIKNIDESCWLWINM
jgi:hypothetical protein